MNEYTAVFYSHFGAAAYCKALKKQGIAAKLAPVPRKISASCGSCVRYAHSRPIEVNDCDLEAIYAQTGDKLECVVKTDDE